MKKILKKAISLCLSVIMLSAMTVSTIVTANAAATTTEARFYSDITTSPAYINYPEFAKLYNFTYSTPMPGMVNTNVNGTNCSTMTPQGICFAKDYLLVSAYDSLNSCNSVLYVISNTDTKNRKFLTSLVLPIKTHVGGIAFDGSYVWVSNGKKASSISYSTLNSKVNTAVSSGSQSISVTFSTTCSILTESSFMTYYNNMLWVGEFKEKDTGDGQMYAYTISSDKKTLTKKYRMTVPDRTQGVCFKDDYLIVSRSYCRSLSASQYISQFRIYRPSFSSPTSDGLIYKNNAVKVVTLPPMAEGVVAGSTYVYTAYESCATKYATGSDGGGKCAYPVDRIVAFNFTDLVATNSDVTSATTAVTEPTETPTSNVSYFPACDSSQTTIISALESVGADSSYAYRAKIAEANGITDYSGTASQNTQMLNLLKSGKLIKPAETEATEATEATTTEITEPTEANTTNPGYYLLGDVNCDGSISILDATETQKILSGMIVVNDDIKKLADVNIDETVNIKDATLIQMYCAGLVSGFPELPNTDNSEPTVEATEESTVESNTEPTTSSVNYFPACDSSYTTIVSALNAIGADSSYTYRKTIAEANGITNYTGTSEQNTQMLNLLKQGKLIVP